MTALGQERITEDAFDLGADYFMLKPFDNKMLLNRIKHIRRDVYKRQDQDEDLKLVGKAHNGEEICNIIKEKQPDVVVLDIIMPKVDGLSVMERFSHDENLKKVPSFIVVSAVGQERITEDAFDLGADYFMRCV